MKKTSHLLLSFATLFLFTACGGGGGGSSTTTTDAPIQTAQLLDSEIGGVDYTCGTLSGVTDTNGTFEYRSDCTVTFKVGNITLGTIHGGSINDDKKLFPTEIVGVPRTDVSHPTVVTMLRFVQSLDDDNDTSNGITVAPATKEVLKRVTPIDITNGTSFTTLQNIVEQNLSKTFITETVAKSHFVSTLTQNNITNNPPIFSGDTNVTVAENQTAVTTIEISDSDGDTLSSTISGTDSSYFSYTNGVIAFRSAPDFETKSSYSFTLSISDGKDTITRPITVSLRDIGEKPVLGTLSNFTIRNNQVLGTSIGDVDVDSYGYEDANMSYTLSGVGSENFTITRNGTIMLSESASLNGGITPTYELNLTATNQFGTSNSIPVTIDIVPYYQRMAKVTKPNPKSSDYFGSGIATYGNYIVVGSNSADYNSTMQNSGAVYVYEKNSDNVNDITLKHTLTPIAKDGTSNLQSNGYFGSGVAIDGDTIVTADARPYEPGRVYLYKMTPSGVVSIGTIETNTTVQSFGYSIAIKGNYIAVGASGDSTKGSNAGKVYLYRLNEDNTTTDLGGFYGSDASKDSFFGSSVAIEGKYVTVGAYANFGAFSNGAIYVFKITPNSDTNITQIAKLSPSGSYTFGQQVSIDGEYIVGTAPSETYTINGTTYSNSGAGYLYKINTTGESETVDFIGRFAPEEPQTNAYFGNSVDIRGDIIAIGSYGYDDTTNSNITDSGKAYLFKRHSDTSDGIRELQNFTQSYDNSNARFGSGISLEDNYFVAGALQETIQGNGGAGSFSLYSKTMANQIAIYDTQEHFEIDEGTTDTIYTIDADSPFSALNYEITGGADQNMFSIDGNKIAFASSPDFESPQDGDNNNTYEVSVTLSDASNNEATITRYFTIKDKKYALTRITGTLTEGLGRSIDSSGDYFVENKSIYKKTTQGYEKILTILTPVGSKLFGNAVAIDGNYIVVADKNWETNTSTHYIGAAYLYKFNPTDNNLTLITTLKPDILSANNYFGSSVAISGNYIVIGAPGNSESASNAGATYLFKIAEDGNSATQIGKYFGTISSAFGTDVAIDGNYFISSKPNGLGSVLLYKIGDDDNTALIHTLDTTTYGYFGSSIALDGNYIAVGARDEKAGYIYSFTDSSVTQLGRVTPQSSYFTNSDIRKFGSNIALKNKTIAITSYVPPYYTPIINDSLFVYKIANDNSVVQYDEAYSDLLGGKEYGQGLGISDDGTILVGASGEGTLYIHTPDANQN